MPARGEPGVLRAQARSRRKHLPARANIAAGEPDPLAARRNLLHHDLVAFLHAVLLHHDGVRPRGNGRAGEDACRGPGNEGLARRAGGDFLGDLEPGSGSFQICETHRVTVHRAVVHGRHVHGRALRRSEHPAGRRKRRHCLSFSDGTRGGEKLLERLVYVEQALVHLNPL
jgi:hypothetical protein